MTAMKPGFQNQATKFRALGFVITNRQNGNHITHVRSSAKAYFLAGSRQIVDTFAEGVVNTRTVSLKKPLITMSKTH
ncbi:TPA: hypothetical protein R4Y75_000091 [Enterobacter asburiae]|nr:hypothetical protein [Enterobacter asburiae]